MAGHCIAHTNLFRASSEPAQMVCAGKLRGMEGKGMGRTKYIECGNCQALHGAFKLLPNVKTKKVVG